MGGVDHLGAVSAKALRVQPGSIVKTAEAPLVDHHTWLGAPGVVPGVLWVGGSGGVRGEPLSPGSSGARSHATIRPSRIRKLVRAVSPVPEPQPPVPPGPVRLVSLNRAFT